jgi:hypothetical protein
VEALYQAVWGQVFGLTWDRLRGEDAGPITAEKAAVEEANLAAAAAVRRWSHSLADQVVHAKGQEP